MKKLLPLVALLSACKLPAAELLPPEPESAYGEFEYPPKMIGEIFRSLAPEKSCEQLYGGTVCKTEDTTAFVIDYNSDGEWDYEYARWENNERFVYRQDEVIFLYSIRTIGNSIQKVMDAYTQDLTILERKVFVDSNGNGSPEEVQYFIKNDFWERYIMIDSNDDGVLDFQTHIYRDSSNGLSHVVHLEDEGANTVVDKVREEWLSDGNGQQFKSFCHFLCDVENIALPKLHYLETLHVPVLYHD